MQKQGPEGGRFALIAESLSTTSKGIEVTLVRNAQDDCEQAQWDVRLCRNFGADPKIYYKQQDTACKSKTNDWYCKSDHKGVVNGRSCEKRQRDPRLH